MSRLLGKSSGWVRAISFAVNKAGSTQEVSRNVERLAVFQTQNRLMGNKSSKNMRRKGAKNGIRGTRGSRGTGWLIKYREGRGGRHLQGRWNVDVEKMKEWNEKIMGMSEKTTKVFMDLEYVDEGGAEGSADSAVNGEGEEDDGRKVGRVTIELADSILPLTTENFASRVLGSVGSNGGVEKVEKNVGVVFDTLGSNEGGGKARLIVGEEDDDEDAATLERELGYMKNILAVKNADGQALTDEADIRTYRDGEAMALSWAPKGVVGMIRDTKMGTSTTAFLITTEDGGAKHLQGGGVGIGRVVDGLDVIKALGGGFTMKGKLGRPVKIAGVGIVE